MKKRVISLLLVLCMLFSAIPMVSAADTVSNPKFVEYNLVMNESVAVNFRLAGYDGNNFDRVDFILDGAVAQTVNTLKKEADGTYLFRFTELSPDEMAKPITVNFYLKGSDAPSATATKSVKDYAVYIMNDPNQSLELKTAMMDMLNYGQAFQEYKAKKADVELEPEELLTYGLTNAQRGYASYKTPTLNDISKVEDQTGKTVQWKSFGLTLEEVVKIYYDVLVTEGDAEDLTMKLTVDGKSFEVTEFAFVKTTDDGDLYRARFDKLNPIQMKSAIESQIFNGDEAVSAKYTTSIESYAAKTNDAAVQAVVKQMMMYGGATEEWVEGKEEGGEGDGDAVVTATNAIYVASTATPGEGDGTEANPLANIIEARDMIRAMKANGEYPEGGVTVYFRGGNYMFSETAYFNTEDAGEEGAPVVYTAYPGEEVNFVGGMSFDAADFTAVTDQAVISRLADPAHTKMLDLKSQGLYDYGQLHVYGMAASYFTSAGIPIQTQAAPELFFGDQVMQLAKYPDGDNTWLKIVSVKQVGDVIQNWNHSTAHGNNYIPPEDRPAIEDIKNSIFTVQDSVTERMQNWTQAEDIWVYGWWEVDYSDQSMPVKELSVDDKGRGVVETGIPSGKKITQGRRFYFYNLLEEITEPGEYYIDRENGILYAYLPSDTGSISYGSLDGPVIKLGGGCKYMTVEGINFSTGQTNGIDLDGVENVTLKNLDVSGFTQKGITLSNCRDTLVTGCHVHQTGSGGITMSYSSAKEPYATAIKTLTPLNVVIENCDIHDYSRISKTYSAGVATAGIGTIVRNCKIYNGDHYAISLNGNDTIIENCEIFNVLRSAGDSGAIYNGFSKDAMGQVVRNNFFHDIGSGTGDDVQVIYMDDTKDGVTFESNLLVNIGGRGFFMNGGWDNVAQNNIMINVKSEGLLGDMGMGGSSRYNLDDGNYDAFKKIYNNPEVYQGHLKYPHWEGKLETLYDTANGGKFYNAPRYNVIKNNILVDVTKVVEIYAQRGASAGGEWNEAKSREFNDVNNGIRKALEEVGFVDYANGDFNLKADSAVKALLGDKAPNFSAMGLYGVGCEKPKGFGGEGYAPVTPPTYEGSDSNKVTGALLEEDFSGTILDAWTMPGATLDNGALKLAVDWGKTANNTVRFKEYAGKVQYELDFSVNFGTCTSIDSGIIIVKGMNDAGAEKSLFNLQAKPGRNFSAYDGGGGVRNNVPVEENKIYRVKVICDPVTDTYDFYVDDQPVIIGGKMRADAGDVVAFSGICIDQKSNTTADSTVTFTYDNIRVTAVGYELYREDFASPYALESWTLSGGKNELVDGKLVVTMDKVGGVNHVAPIAEYAGVVTFETDFSVDFKGNTGKGSDGKDLMDGGTILIKGKDAKGTVQSLLNLKVRASTLTFGAYDGNGSYVGQDHETEVKYEENKTYRIKVVCDPYTDSYKMYADDELVMEGYLRYDAVSFTGICINQNRKGGDTAPVFTYDNMLAYTGDGSIVKAPEKEDDVTGGDSASLLYEEYFSDPSTVNNWSAGAPAADDIVINAAGQLQVTKNTTGDFAPAISFNDGVAQEGKVTYEMDFAIDLNGCTDVDPNLFIVKGNDGSKSLLNPKVYIDATTGKMVFGAYDGTNGGSEHPSDVECVDGKTYRITIICDTATDTYDFYANGVEVFKGAALRSDAKNFTGMAMCIHKNTACEHEAPVIYFDNIKAFAGAKNPSSGLYQEDFSDLSTESFWKAGAPAADDVVINDLGQLQVTKNTTGDFAPAVSFNDGVAQEGKVTYEMDFAVDLNGCTDVDPNLFIVKGNDGSKSLLNPKVYIDATTGKMVFGAYDGTNGGSEHPSTVECIEGKSYHIVIICDTATDSYDFYADGVEVFKGAALRSDAKNFTGMAMCIHKNVACEHDAPVIYFDNIAAWAGDVYTGEVGGEEEEPEQPDQPDVPDDDTLIVPKVDFGTGTVLLSDDFATLDTTKWTGCGTKAVGKDGAMVVTLAGGDNGGCYPVLSTKLADTDIAKKLVVEYDVKMNGDTSTTFEAGILLKKDGGTTLLNVGFKQGNVYAQSTKVGTYENGKTYRVVIVTDPETGKANIYVGDAHLEVTLGGQWNDFRFMIKGNNGTAAQSVTFDNLKVSEWAEKPATPETPDAPEGITLGEELATNHDGSTLELTANALKIITMNTPATGKVAVQYKIKVKTTGEGFNGKAFFKGNNPNTTTFANVGFWGNKVNTNGVDIAGVTYEDDTWYNVFILMDIDAKTYDIYLDGQLVKEDRAWENGAASTNLNQLYFNADCNAKETAAGTVWFEDISVHQVTAIETPEEPEDPEQPEVEIKEVLAFDDFSNGKGNWTGGTVVDGALEVTQTAGGSDVYIDFNNADFKAEIAKANAANKELLVEFDIALKSGYDATAFEAGFMLKNSADSSKTAIEAVISNGKLRTGYSILAEEAVEDDTFYKIQIICDPATKTIKFYIDGQPLTLTGGYLNSQATWDMVRLMVKGNKGTKDLTVAIDNFKVSLYDGTPILPEDTTEYPEETEGKKALVLGDSLTSAGQWQSKLVTELGMSVETHALGGLSMTAIIDGGTVGSNTLPALTAQQVADKDLIVFYAGYNNRHQTAEAFADTLMVSVNKIKALLAEAENTECRIMIVAPHFVGKSQWLYGSSVPLDGDDVPPADSPSATVSLETLVNAMVAEAQENYLPVYDLFHNSGIGPDTWNTYSNQKADENGYVPGTTNWADQVHLNSTGYALIGEQIAQFVLENWDFEYKEPEQPEEPETPAFPEDITLGDELATDWNGTTLELTANATKIVTLSTPATGKVAVQYKTKVVTTAEGFNGKAFFKGMTPDTKTIANLGFQDGKLNTYGVLVEDVTYEDDTWYNVLIVFDIDAKNYDVYLNGKLIREDRAWEDGATATDLKQLYFNADCNANDKTAAGTVWFEDISVHQVTAIETPAEPEPKVLYQDDFTNLDNWTITNNDTVTTAVNANGQLQVTLASGHTSDVYVKLKTKDMLDSTKKTSIKFDLMTDGDASTADFEVALMLRGTSTAVSVGFKAGTLRAQYGDTKVAVEKDKLYTVEIITDPNTNSISLYLNGELVEVTYSLEYKNSQTSWQDLWFVVKQNKSEYGKSLSAYIDNLVISEVVK